MTISCIVPNYRHERFLRERLDSILGQTRLPDEVLLLDDASTDGSQAILEEYADRGGDHWRCVFNEENSGSAFAQWNKGVGLASGDLIWMAESDDVAEATLLETLVSAFDGSKDRVLAVANSVVIDENGTELERVDRWYRWLDEERWGAGFDSAGIEVARGDLAIQSVFPNASAVLFRKTAFELIGGASTEYPLVSDWLSWNRMARCGSVRLFPEILNRFRRHEATERAANQGDGKDLIQYHQIWTLFQKELDLPEATRRQIEALSHRLLVEQGGLQSMRLSSRWNLVREFLPFRPSARHWSRLLPALIS